MHYRHFEEDIEEPEKVRKMIDVLGELFRSIQELSKKKYFKNIEHGKDPTDEKDKIRKTSQIGISTTSEEIKDYLIDIIEQAVEVQLLQIPLLPRKPQLSSKSPYRNLKFHRLLTPYFSLAVQNRHPRNIKSEIFNLIIDDSEKFLKTLMKNWDEYKVPSQEVLEFDHGKE